MKTFTHQHALHEGHPFRWTSDDVDHARELANTLTRPWGYQGASPEEAWQACASITAEERELFLATVTLERFKAASQMISDDTTELDKRVPANINRQALSQSLQDLNYLHMTHVTRPPKKPRRRSCAKLAERAIKHGMPPSMAERLTNSSSVSAVPSSSPATTDARSDASRDEARLATDDCQTASRCEAMPIVSVEPPEIPTTETPRGKKLTTSLSVARTE